MLDHDWQFFECYQGAKNFTNAFFPLFVTCSSKSDSFKEITDPALADRTNPKKQTIRIEDIAAAAGSHVAEFTPKTFYTCIFDGILTNGD